MEYIQKYWVPIIIVFGISMFINPAICLLIMGALVSYISIIAFGLLKKLEEKGVESMGRILSYQVEKGGYKTPIIEFTPLSGEPVTAKPFLYASTDLSKIRSYSNLIDTEVLVRYDPDDPKKFVITGKKRFNYVVITTLILGGFFFIILGTCILLGYLKFGGQ